MNLSHHSNLLDIFRSIVEYFITCHREGSSSLNFTQANSFWTKFNGDLFNGAQQDSHEVILHFFGLLRNQGCSAFDEKVRNMSLTKLVCTFCKTESHSRMEENLILTVPILESSTISELIQQYCDSENNQICPICKNNKRSVIKWETMNDVVILQLNRFATNLTKLTTDVKLESNINIELSAGPKEYELFGIIDHIGNQIQNGHYVSYVQCRGHWYEFNDAEVTRYDMNAMFDKVKSSCYILFYRYIHDIYKDLSTQQVFAQNEKEEEAEVEELPQEGFVVNDDEEDDGDNDDNQEGSDDDDQDVSSDDHSSVIPLQMSKVDEIPRDPKRHKVYQTSFCFIQ